MNFALPCPFAPCLLYSQLYIVHTPCSITIHAFLFSYRILQTHGMSCVSLFTKFTQSVLPSIESVRYTMDHYWGGQLHGQMWDGDHNVLMCRCWMWAVPLMSEYVLIFHPHAYAMATHQYIIAYLFALHVSLSPPFPSPRMNWCLYCEIWWICAFNVA